MVSNSITNRTVFEKDGRTYIEYTLIRQKSKKVSPNFIIEKEYPFLKELPLISKNSDSDVDTNIITSYIVYDITDVEELKDEKPHLFI